MTKFVLTLLLITLSHPAIAQWSPPVISKDEMTDREWGWTELSTTTPSSKFMDHAIQQFTIRCRNGKLEVIGHTKGYVGNQSGKIEYRAGNTTAKTIKTSVSTHGRSYFIVGVSAINFLKDVTKSDEVRINAYDYQGTTSFSRFAKANENTDAVLKVADMCKVNLRK